MVEEINGIEENHDAVGLKKIWEKAGYDAFNMIAPPGADQKLLAETIKQRSPSIIQAGQTIYQEVKNMFGENDPRSIALKIVNDIGENFNELAISQLETFDPESAEDRSWRSFNSEACDKLKEKIGNYLAKEEYSMFWQENPEFAESLGIISDRLIDESTPEGFKSISENLERLNLQALENNRKFFVLLSYDDYFSNPNRAQGNPKIWEADIQLLYSLPESLKEKVMAIEEDASTRMAELFHTEQIKSPALIGNVAIGYGIECLSVIAGQAYGNGYATALNMLEKKRSSWEKTEALSGRNTEFSAVLDNIIFLYLAHEKGHEYSRQLLSRNNGRSRLLDEIVTDIPSVIALFEKNLDRSSGKVNQDNQENLENTIRLIFSIYSSDFFETSEEDPAVIKGYRISTSYILNEILKSGLVFKKDEQLGLGVSCERTKIDTFLNNLRQVKEKVLANDPQTLEDLENTTQSPELEEIANSLTYETLKV